MEQQQQFERKDPVPQRGYAYAIRVDLVDGLNLADLTAFLVRRSTEAVYCVDRVDEKNPHLHAYLESPHKHGAFRESLKRSFPVVRGNGGYSIKKSAWRPLQYLSYLFKPEVHGGEKVVASRTFPVGLLDEARDRAKAYLEQQAIRDRQKKQGVLPALAESCVTAERQRLVSQGISAINADWQSKNMIDIQLVCDTVYEESKKSGKVMQEWRIKNYIYSILSRFNNTFANALKNRLFNYFNSLLDDMPHIH